MGFVIVQAFISAIVIYLLTLLLSHIIGRKMVSGMTFFDYIVGIMIGSAAVNASSLNSNPQLSSVVTLIVICLLTTLIDIIHIHSIKIRKIVNSEPIVIIAKGEIMDKNMRKVRLTLDELNMMLREKGYFNIGDVENAILESHGRLSVQAKAEKLPLTPSDISLFPDYKGLTRDIIMDGKILEDNLKYIGKNEQWLKKQLAYYGVTDISNVFYAGLDTSGNFYISKRQHSPEVPGKHGIE